MRAQQQLEQMEAQMIENSNDTWRVKVWSRFEHGSLSDLQERLQRHVTALRRHRAEERIW